jgi:hypothetical protein
VGNQFQKGWTAQDNLRIFETQKWSQQNFSAMIEYTDKLVGRIVKSIDELGLAENTLLIVTRSVKKLSRALDTAKSGLSSICQRCISAELTCVTIPTRSLQPWQLFLLILASWANRQQQEIIEYLRTENAVLKEKLGKKRILLTDDQRRRL